MPYIKVGNENLNDIRIHYEDHGKGTSASAIATHDCVSSWLTDFRLDLPKIDIPCLIIHGDDDRILPIEVTAEKLVKTIKARLVKIPNGSHAIPWTHPDIVNDELLNFISEQSIKQVENSINYSLDLP